MQRTLTFFVFASILVLTPSAFARSVFLNGVNISELKGKTFKDATIYIDENGDIHIEAPKYKVKVIDQPAAPPMPPDVNGGSNPALAGHYFLVTNPSPNGRAQYDFAVTINGVERKVIPAASPQMILEISAWLRPGANQVTVSAKKQLGDGRKSSSAEDKAKLLIGKGHEEGTSVKIDAVYMTLQVDASQSDNKTQYYTLEAR